MLFPPKNANGLNIVENYEKTFENLHFYSVAAALFLRRSSKFRTDRNYAVRNDFLGAIVGKFSLFKEKIEHFG